MKRFLIQSETPRDQLDWGSLGWLSNPPVTGSEYLTVIDVELLPGSGHDFHKHPDQEESIVCVKGPVEQWVEQERRMLSPGDAAFIPADCVHATFNDGDEPAKVIAILGPCVDDIGYELVDVADQAPRNSLSQQEYPRASVAALSSRRRSWRDAAPGATGRHAVQCSKLRGNCLPPLM